MKNNPIIAIIGLGYVGLPLAVEFSKKYKVIEFCINTMRVDKLIKENDSISEFAPVVFIDLYKSSTLTPIFVALYMDVFFKVAKVFVLFLGPNLLLIKS